MGIFSKQLLYAQTVIPPVEKQFKAYKIKNGTLTELGTITDTSKTFACQDEFIYSNLYVFNGDLYSDTTRITTSGNVTALTGRTTSSDYYAYYIEDGKLMKLDSTLATSQIGSDTTWSKCSGYTGVSNNYVAFALNSSGLYSINNDDTTTLISSITSWDKIVGYGSTSASSYFGYGLSGGKLYYLYANGSGAVQKTSDTTWTDVTGSREGTSYYGYGINGGKLYQLKSTSSPAQVGSDTTWSKISGTASSSFKALGINNGALYSISITTPTLIDNSHIWIACSGFAYGSYYGLAYDEDALYSVDSSGTLTQLATGSFAYCGENYSDVAIGIAIKEI